MPPPRKKPRNGRTPVSGRKVKGGTRIVSTTKKTTKKKSRRTAENPTGVKVFLHPDDFDKQQKKCLAFMKSVGLSKPRTPYDPFVVDHCSISPSTQEAYELSWDEMCRFFYLIEDFQSAMLVDREICPRKPLPFLPDSFALFMTYRCAEEGLPLIHPRTGTQVRDYKNRLMTTVGGWSAPSMLGKCHSATLFLHEVAYHETCSGPYKLACTACVKKNCVPLYTEEQDETHLESLPKDLACMPASEMTMYITERFGFYKSCKKHANKPPLESTGNVLMHPVAKNTYSAWYKLKAKVHIKKGCGQLIPAEMRKLRKHLLNIEGGVAAFQLYVMILLGIRLFLRCTELVTLRVDNFRHSYSGTDRRIKKRPPKKGLNYLTKLQTVNPTAVESLIVEIQGKCDNHPQKLALFSDYEYPEFDELRHLLWYMKMFNIRDGYLFPPPSVLVQQWHEGSRRPLKSEVHFEYRAFLRAFKQLVHGILGREKGVFIVGTHTMRKTAYLFAIWGFYFSHKMGVDIMIPGKFECKRSYRTYLK